MQVWALATLDFKPDPERACLKALVASAFNAMPSFGPQNVRYSCSLALQEAMLIHADHACDGTAAASVHALCRWTGLPRCHSCSAI